MKAKKAFIIKLIYCVLALILAAGAGCAVYIFVCPPSPPGGLSIELVNSNNHDYVHIEWKPVFRAEEYNIYTADDPDGQYTFVDSTKSESIKSLDYSTGMRQWYIIKAVRNEKEGRPSEPISIKIPYKVILSHYSGSVKDGKMHGKGVFTWPNGDVYIGDFIEDLKTGRGKYEWEDGRTYVGGVKDSAPHEEGVYTWPDGEMYRGEFHEGWRHGWGMYIWTNGDWYEGEWVRGLMTGYGLLCWADGSYFEGQFADDLLHGLGTMYHSSGEIETGYWEEGNFIGEELN